MNNNISINKLVKPLVERLLDSAEELNLGVDISDGGTKIVYALINHSGCLESGRIIT